MLIRVNPNPPDAAGEPEPQAPYVGEYPDVMARLRFAEARVIEKLTGLTISEIQSTRLLPVDAIAAQVFVALKRRHPTMRFAELDDWPIDVLTWHPENHQEREALRRIQFDSEQEMRRRAAESAGEEFAPEEFVPEADPDAPAPDGEAVPPVPAGDEPADTSAPAGPVTGSTGSG